MRVEFLDCHFDVLTMEQTVAEIGSALSAGRFLQHGVVNVAKLMSMRDDPELKEAVESCDIVNVDGMGVVWGAKFLGLTIPERVTGIDLFRELLALSETQGHSVFLLGGTSEIVDHASAKIEQTFPRLKIAGKHHGYFWDRESEIVETVRQSGAELLFVAISSPLKEKFIARWRDQLGVTFVMGVGGTFDVVAGKVNRAPLWMQRFGLEWFYRVIQEPRRLWRRYLVSNARYGALVLSSMVAAWFTDKELAGFPDE